MHFITILWNKLSIYRYNIYLCHRLACWADYEHTIQVESGNLQSQQIPGVPSHHKPVQALIIFKTHPITLMASMIIDKHVRPLFTAGNTHIIIMVWYSTNNLFKDSTWSDFCVILIRIYDGKISRKLANLCAFTTIYRYLAKMLLMGASKGEFWWSIIQEISIASTTLRW